MKKLMIAVFACCLSLAAGGAFAADMTKDSMGKGDAMSKDSMGKGDAMTKDSMSKDAMKKPAKTTSTKKDAMATDMNKGGMAKDTMSKDEMKK